MACFRHDDICLQDATQWEAALRPTSRIIYTEAITNPLLEVLMSPFNGPLSTCLTLFLSGTLQTLRFDMRIVCGVRRWRTMKR